MNQVITKKIILDKKIQIHKNGMQERDFIYTEDTQSDTWISCLNYAKELEDQLKHYKDND